MVWLDNYPMAWRGDSSNLYFSVDSTPEFSSGGSIIRYLFINDRSVALSPNEVALLSSQRVSQINPPVISCLFSNNSSKNPVKLEVSCRCVSVQRLPGHAVVSRALVSERPLLSLLIQWLCNDLVILSNSARSGRRWAAPVISLNWLDGKLGIWSL